MATATGKKNAQLVEADMLACEAEIDSRISRIHAISALAITARDDAKELGLKFEAHLLDMAVLALSEHTE